MKTLIPLLLSSVFLPSTTVSQVNGNYKFAIAIRAIDVKQFAKVYDQVPDKYMEGSFSGVMLKLNDNQFSYRISGNYINTSVVFNQNCMSSSTAQGNVMDYSFKVGFEKNINYARMQPYLGMDVGYRYNRFSGIMSAVNSQTKTMLMSNVRDTKDGAVLGVIVGIKINPADQFALFIESGMEFYYAYVKQQITPRDGSAMPLTLRFNRGDFLLNTVSIGLQVHLANKN